MIKSGLSQAGYSGSTTARPTQNVNIVAQRMPSHSGALILGSDLRAMIGSLCLYLIHDIHWCQQY